MTGKTPKERFQQHKDGVKAARFVYLYGVRLRPRLYERRNPMTYEQAQRMERTIADGLRKRGYAVWQN
ncbi:MAG TPA: hypothetical protein VE869_15425 [Gemmatimonas sp.]|nr:hypothetical protein [Gemmatimonas sp.]